MRENNIENQIKRERKIISKKNKNLSFKEIGIQIGMPETTVSYYYYSGITRKILEKKGIDTSNIGYSLLAELRQLNLSDKVKLGKEVQIGKIKNRNELRKRKDELLVADHNPQPKHQQSQQLTEIESLNGINTEYKLITKYKDLAEKVIRTMRKERLEKYSKNTQDFCLQIMGELNKHLKDQLEQRCIIVVESD